MPKPPPLRCTPPLEAQVSPLRAAIGDRVARRLEATPMVRRLPTDEAAIYCLPHFLSRNECARMVRTIDASCVPSKEFRTGGGASRRSSSSHYFLPDHAEAAAVSRRIADLLGLSPGLCERMQGQRYEVGQEFRVHPDFFAVDQPYWPQVSTQGGQRTWTAMVYLNEPEAGGTTRFPYAELEVKPERGLLLAWNNMKPDGSPNLWTFHEGAVVIAGSKYILTQWFREQLRD